MLILDNFECILTFGKKGIIWSILRGLKLFFKWFVLWFGILQLLILGVPFKFGGLQPDGSLHPLWFMYCIAVFIIYTKITLRTPKHDKRRTVIQITTLDDFNFTVLDINNNRVINTTSQEMRVIYYAYCSSLSIILKTATINRKGPYKVDIDSVYKDDNLIYLLENFKSFGIETDIRTEAPTSNSIDD